MKLPVGLGIGGFFTFILAIVVGWWGFRAFLNSQIAANVGLKEGSEMREMWSKFPEPLEFKVYLLNVTNPADIHTGAKPIVNEIGPFIYDQYKSKINMKDNEEEDTVSYDRVDSWFFNKEKSAPLTGEEIITIPHVLILGTVLVVERDRPGSLAMLNKALPPIYGHPPNVFLTSVAKKILFEGVVVNCTVKEFSAKAICTAMKQNTKDFDFIEEDVFKFSFFGKKNSTPNGRFTVNRGIKNVMDVGKVEIFDGESVQSVWKGDPCNDIVGTDSTIFHPFLTPADDIVAYSPDLCRSIAAVYQESFVLRNIPVNLYLAEIGDLGASPETRCYCESDDTCLKKGAMDLSRCVGAPIVATQPHFYMTSDVYLNMITGLNPTKELHEITMSFEPITATPISAHKRLQFNMFIHKVEKVDLMKDLPEALMPLFWVDEGIELPQKYLDVLDGQLFRALRIVGALKWIMMAVGLGLGGAGAYLHYKKRDSLAVTPNEGSQPQKVLGMAPLDVREVNGSPRY